MTPQQTQTEETTPEASEVPSGTTREGMRTYSTLERTVAVMLASIIGAGPAAKQLDYPRRTVNDWMEKHGGVAELREAARQVLGHSLYTTAVWLCDELRKRAGDMTTEQITKVLPTRTAGAVGPLMGSQAESKAAPILIQFNNGRGGYDTLPVPSDPDA